MPPHVGLFEIQDSAGNPTIRLDGETGDIAVLNVEGEARLKFSRRYSALYIGPEGGGSNEGDIRVYDQVGNVVFLISGGEPGGEEGAYLDLGAIGNDGDIRIRNDKGDVAISLNGAGGEFATKSIIVNDYSGREVFRFDANSAALWIGATGNEGDIRIRNNDGQDVIHLNGQDGDIYLTGADCAELFEIAEPQGVDPGTVLVVDEEGLLRPCQEAYDRRVAGIVSGAGGLRPGITLGAVSGGTNRLPIALTGRAYCKVDAQFGAIKVGDLLTSSSNKGHAMIASDGTRAFGAVIGKALQAYDTGQGLIPVLVALQ
jgi:hypothetical protein